MKLAMTIAAIAAGAAALISATSDLEETPDSELTAVPWRNAPLSSDRRWVPDDHVLDVNDTRSVKKIDAANQPCTVWIKLPAGESYYLRKTAGSAGVRQVAYHELEDATWSAFSVYRSGDFKIAVRSAHGEYKGHFSIKVSNVGRG